MSEYLGYTIVRVQRVNTTERIGYVITTDHDPDLTISLTQDNQSICCETWGSRIMNEHGELLDSMDSDDGGDGDNVEINMVGQTIIDVHWARGHNPHRDEEMDEEIVEINTNFGTYQLVSWTRHNGYYPHNHYGEWVGCGSHHSQ